MICFSLICAKDHRFDSWFSGSDDFDKLQAAKHLSCPQCGDHNLRKALMAPAIATSKPDPSPAPPAVEHARSPMMAGDPEMAKALAKLRAEVEANADYVGTNFAAEARAIHLGDRPARPIYGEAKIEEARALMDDGIQVAPLPFMPRAKVN